MKRKIEEFAFHVFIQMININSNFSLSVHEDWVPSLEAELICHIILMVKEDQSQKIEHFSSKNKISSLTVNSHFNVFWLVTVDW